MNRLDEIDFSSDDEKISSKQKQNNYVKQKNGNNNNNAPSTNGIVTLKSAATVAAEEAELFDDEFDPDAEQQRGELTATEKAGAAGMAAALPSVKRNKLAADWMRDSKNSQVLTLDEINKRKQTESSQESTKPNIAIKKKAVIPTELSLRTYSGPTASAIPQVGKIYKGKVAMIEPHSVFVNLESPYPTGLVHESQISINKVDPRKTFKVHQHVFVKVLRVTTTDSGKTNIDLSLKYCDQVPARFNF